MRTERGARGIVARYIGFVGVVLLAAVPVYVYVEPPWRAPVTRLAAALVVGVALLELRAALARRVSRSSALEDARRRHATESGVPARLLDLMDDVRAAAWSRRYFEGILWPRLATLARDLPERPPSRSLRRGPSLKKLGDIITSIERRS